MSPKPARTGTVLTKYLKMTLELALTETQSIVVTHTNSNQYAMTVKYIRIY